MYAHIVVFAICDDCFIYFSFLFHSSIIITIFVHRDNKSFLNVGGTNLDS